MHLAGRTALVTGASRGVGRALAWELAKRGANLVLAARTVTAGTSATPGTLEETAERARSLGAETLIVAADLNDPESVERLAGEAVAWKGHVDVLINNAAFLGKASFYDLGELDLKNFARQFNVNVTAPFLLSKAVVPGMRKAGAGVIANVSSEAALIAAYDVPGIAYGSTKAALNRLTTLLARDLRADGIAVFAVDPGYTLTYLTEKTADQAGTDITEAHPPDVPARVIADLVEADLEQSTGRVWKAVRDKKPVLVADGARPVPEGTETDLGLAHRPAIG